jgi:outer membrane protein
MKRIFKKLLVAGVTCSLLTCAAQAQTKIGVIDLSKVFNEYHKRIQAESILKEETAELEKQRKEMIEDFKKGEDDWKKLIDKANDQAITIEERNKSKQAAEKKLVELKGLEQALTQFDRSSRATVNEKMRRKRDAILVEVREVINAKAKASGYTMVVDTAALSINETPILLYTNGENDLTESVLTQLNANAPPAPKATEEKPKVDEKK